MKQESKAGSGGGGGGGGKPDPGGKKGWEWFNKDWFKEVMQPQHRITWLSLAGAAAAWYMLTRSSEEHRQISWQEFRTSYLEQGEVGCSVKKKNKKRSLFFFILLKVDRLEVVNRNIVRVHLRRDRGMTVRHAPFISIP